MSPLKRAICVFLFPATLRRRKWACVCAAVACFLLWSNQEGATLNGGTFGIEIAGGPAGCRAWLSGDEAPVGWVREQPYYAVVQFDYSFGQEGHAEGLRIAPRVIRARGLSADEILAQAGAAMAEPVRRYGPEPWRDEQAWELFLRCGGAEAMAEMVARGERTRAWI